MLHVYEVRHSSKIASAPDRSYASKYTAQRQHASLCREVNSHANLLLDGLCQGHLQPGALANTDLQVHACGTG